MKIQMIVVLMILASCTPKNYTSTEAIHTPAAISTRTRIPLPTASIPPVATATTTAAVWEIWFSGFSCEGVELCELGPNQDLYYFSIKSDGTELKTLSITEFPAPQLPAYAPPLPDGFAATPQLSPDKSMLTYAARGDDRFTLYTVDVTGDKITPLYTTEKVHDHIFWIGTACWMSTGHVIEFLLHSRRGNENQPPILYTIDMDGNHPQPLFNFPGLENAWFGACSPDGEELVLTIPGNTKVEENGIYLINRNTGHVRQILSHFFVSNVRTPYVMKPNKE
jgi:hypothetical protein